MGGDGVPGNLSRILSCASFVRGFLAHGSLALVLASCGGGGGQGPTNEGPGLPFIAASLVSFPPGATPAGLNTNATVEVFDGSGLSRSDASVTINGQILAFSMANQDYEGDVVVAPGGDVSLSVTLAGVTYAASGKQFTSYPTISAPATGARWAQSIPNVLSWSGGVPVANAFYAVGILDAADPNGNLVWPLSQTLDIEPPGTNAVTVPSGILSTGHRLAIAGVATAIGIPNADPESGLIIAGFSSVRFDVVVGTTSATLQSITVVPSNEVIRKGTTQQYTAFGAYSDGNNYDLTTQVAWTSSDPTKATISNTGSATGVSAGAVTVTATVGSIFGSVPAGIVPAFLPGPKYPNLATTFNPSLGDTAIGDLNGDGINDVAVIGSLDNRILVYYGNAQGTLELPQEITTDLTLKGIAVADVNNDGRADLVVAGISRTAMSGFLGRIAIFRQDAVTGLPITPDQLTLSTDLPVSVAVADLNGDSLPDIVSAGQGSGGNGVVSLFFQTILGGLGPEVPYTSVPVEIAADHGEMHVADMNSDGLNDIVVQSGPLQFAVIRQVSPGTFSGTPDLYTVQTSFSSNFQSFALGDLNGDGRTDVAVAELSGNLNIFYQNDGGTLTGPALLPGNQATEVHIADLDGDGLNDIVLLSGGNNIRMRYQTADHSFRNPVFYNLATGSTGGTITHQAMSIGDVTRDGPADIVVSWSREGIFVLQRLP